MTQTDEGLSNILLRLSTIDLARIKQIFAILGIETVVTSETFYPDGSYRFDFILELPYELEAGKMFEFYIHRFFNLAEVQSENNQSRQSDPADIIITWLKAIGAQLPYEDVYNVT